VVDAPLAQPSASRPLRARATPFEQRDIEVLGLRIRYIDVGPDAPGASGLPLLLIHGHTSRIEEYDDLVPHFARHHRVLVCDLPGCGYSDKPHQHPYSLKLYEDVLLGFLDRLGIGAAYIGGGSLGGNLVLRLGHRVPDRFSRLVAWAPAGAWKPAPIAGRLMRMLGGSVLFWPAVWGQSRFWFEKSWPGREAALREAFAYYREVHCRGFQRMYWEVAADQIEQSHFAYAHEIQQPTLLAWGDRDHGMNMGEGVKRLSELMPQARLQVFEGARHSLANEIPEKLARAANDFLLSAPEATPLEAAV
jgi:pimeloyl-ACP methyl ester carboxylesterase